jgi:hypothetical protein
LANLSIAILPWVTRLGQTANNSVFVHPNVAESDDQSDMTTKDELPDCEQNAAMNIDNLLEKINL